MSAPTTEPEFAGPGEPTVSDRPPQDGRSRSRSSPRRRGGSAGGGRRGSHSRSRSYSRSRSRSPPPAPAPRRRSRSPPSRRRRDRSRSRSWSGSRSPSPQRERWGGRDRDRERGDRGDRSDRDRDRDRDYRERDRDYRGPPPHGPPGDRGPPPDYHRMRGPPPDLRGGPGSYRGGYDGRDFGPPRGGPPPHGDSYSDQYGPGGHGPSGRGPPPRERGRRRRDEAPPGVSLLVRNVSPEITTQDLQMAFGRIGEVRDVYIPRDFHSQQPKGFAFVEYATHGMAREARDEMDRFVVKGRELEVVFAQERRKTPNEMRGRVVNQQNRGGRDDFDRSSSFERHKQRARGEGRNRDESKRPGSSPDREAKDEPQENGS